jgi:hypothetical protein
VADEATPEVYQFHVSKRMVKKQQMRWTERGAHRLPQVRRRSSTGTCGRRSRAVNDVSIRRIDAAWEAMLCQFLERPGRRRIRWDLKTRASLSPQDQREITAYLRDRGLLDAFLREQRESNDECGPAASGPRAGGGRPHERHRPDGRFQSGPWT